jgi:TatD DNase family protein
VQYIDLHTHRPAGDPEVFEIESVFYDKVASGKTPFFSAGLHPWHLQNIDLKEAELWLREQVAQDGCLAVGETGLDKAAAAPWDRQISAFQICHRVAAETGKPLIIHCVRAYGEVVQLLNRPMSPALTTPPAIFHGFNKHQQTARMLLDAGYFLSFGPALLLANSPAAGAFRTIPAAQLFLETDDHNLDIKAVYARAAEIRGWTLDQLLEQIHVNFREVFGTVPA